MRSDQESDAMTKRIIGTISDILASTWHNGIRIVRAMARGPKEDNIERLPEAPEPESPPEMSPGNELFASPVHEELSAQQIFAGDDSFYRSLEGTRTAGGLRSLDPGRILRAPTGYKRLSSVQKALAAAIVLVAAVLLYAVLRSPPGPTDQMRSAASQTPAPEIPVAETVGVTPHEAREAAPLHDSAQPLSLKVAQSFYVNGDYDKALGVYNELHKNVPAHPREEFMRDFLQLQMALCVERTADTAQAGRLLRRVLKSSSPAIRVVASYHYGLLEMQRQQYLDARVKAYQALALLDAIDFDEDYALSLKRDCCFLAAEALTRKALSLCDADKDLPEDLWGTFGAADELFTQLDEAPLRSFLNSGSQRLRQAVLGPQIQRFEHEGEPARYGITCNAAPVEELLARFAAHAAIDIRWESGSEETGIRKRLVYLYLPSATTRQFLTAATGCVGMLARMDEGGVVTILNPATYSYVSEHIASLSEEAVSLWQRFLLRFPEDSRLANIHFALGLLHASKGQPVESMAEYKLVANRFSRSSLAPFALLNSSKLKSSLHDYPGGREDLKQLVEQFPDSEIAGEAYLHLAETTAKAGLKTEAARLYRKVYNLSLSSESQSAAVLGAGKCAYRLGDYESTAKWMAQYVQLAADRKSNDVYSAYSLLGKACLALDNPGAACDAFQHALQGGPSRLAQDEYMETVSALVEVCLQQGHFVRALDMLEDIHSVALSRKESIELLLLRSKAFRAMGLVDKAIAILGDRAEYIPDPQLKAQVCFELSDCYIEKGDLDIARKELADVLVLTESGPLSQKIALRLAEVCLRLGQTSQTAHACQEFLAQAISVCLQLLDLQPSQQIEQEALDVLAAAYNQQKEYDRAALALLGHWK